MDVKVGRIVKILQNEQVPADIILIQSSAPKGSCYIETKNLDGETNLKYKQAIPETVANSQNEEELFENYKAGIHIECEAPNEILYNFQGSI
jgi:P-type E1-E2 ATPase